MRNRLSALVLAAALTLSGAALAQDPDPLAQKGAEAFKALFNGRPEQLSAEFNEEMAKAMTPEVVAAIPGQVTAQAGKLMAMGQPVVQESGPNLKTVMVPLQFEGGRLIGRITYMLDGSTPKIAGLWLNPADEAESAAADANAQAAGPTLPTSSAPYVDASKFKEFPTQLDNVLPAVLSLPSTATPETPAPAVILVHGSGPNDMNETIAANRPFLDIAQGLASKGIAVFRYTKRTAVQPEVGKNQALTMQEEVINDVLLAASMLRDAPGIDGSRVFVLGHSLGAFAAPEIAKQDGQLAGIIMLGAPTTLGPRNVIEQIDYLTAKDQAPANPAREEVIAKMKADMEELLAGNGVAGKLYTGAYKAYWEDLQKRTPVSVLKDSTIPALLLFGERDYQVPIGNADQWKAGLEGRKGARVRTYPTLNHLMITGTGTPMPAEYGTPGYVSMDVINDVAQFVTETKAAGLQF